MILLCVCRVVTGVKGWSFLMAASRRRHPRYALVTGGQTSAHPICLKATFPGLKILVGFTDDIQKFQAREGRLQTHVLQFALVGGHGVIALRPRCGMGKNYGRYLSSVPPFSAACGTTAI